MEQAKQTFEIDFHLQEESYASFVKQRDHNRYHKIGLVPTVLGSAISFIKRRK